MASKSVNTKFAFILGGAVLLLFGLVAGAAYLVIKKSAADNKKEAATFLEKGDIETALAKAGAAVNKEPNNLEYLKYWAEMMERSQPPTPRLYMDRYGREYLHGALLQIANLQRTNVAAHERILAPQLKHLQLFEGQGAASTWVDFITQVNQAMNFFGSQNPEEVKGKALLGRYRGIARVELLQRQFEMSAEDREQARADLEAALAVDPTLEDAMVALGQWEVANIGRLRQDNRHAEADQVLETLKTRLAEFRKVNPTALGPAMAQLQIRLEENRARNAKQPTTLAQVQAESQPLIEPLLTLAEQADPATVRTQAVAGVVQAAIASGLPQGYERGMAIWDRFIAARPGDPVPRYYAGMIAMSAGKPEAAIGYMRGLAEMKDQPLSLEGLLVFQQRPLAQYVQVEASLMLAMNAKPAEREAAMKRVVDLRNAYAKDAPAGQAQVQLLDGKIAYMKGEYADARRLLGDYTEQVPNDPQAIVLLAEIMLRQNALGAARDLLTKFTELMPGSVPGWRTLTEVHLGLRDYQSALRAIKRAEQSDPTNPDVRKRRELVEALIAGSNSSDPVMKALAEAELKANAIPPDNDGARAILRATVEANADSAEAERLVPLINALIIMKEREAADKLIDKAIARFPESLVFPQMKAQAAQRAAAQNDPVAYAASGISEANLTDFEKAMNLFVLYSRQGMKDKAAAEFAKAKALSPDHPLVVSQEFDVALAERRLEDAQKLLERAKALNADKLGGAIYQARFEAASGRLEDAISTAVKAAEADSLNPTAWMLLGSLRLQAGRNSEAVTAMERAVNIKPNDAELILGLVKAKIASGQLVDALRVSRAAVPFAGNNPQFLNFWLELEAQQGNVNEALERRKRMFDQMPDDRMNAGAYLHLLLSTGDYPAAKSVIEKIDAAGWGDQIHPLRALYYASQGRNAEARKVFDDLLAKQPPAEQTVIKYLAFSRAVAALGAVDLAISVLNDGRKVQSPDQMEADRELGDLYFSRARWAEAVTAYEQALESVKVDEGNKLAERIAEAHLRQGKVAEAEAVLARTQPTDDEGRFRVLLLKAEAKSVQRKWSEARPLLAEAVKVQPRNWLGYFKRGEATYREPSLMREAIADLEQALTLNPESNVVRQLLAGLYVADGRSDRGVAVLREGLAANPGDEELRLSLIGGLVKLGKRADGVTLAREAWERTQNLRWAGVAADLYADDKKWASAAQFYAELWKKEPSVTVALRYVQTLMSMEPPDVATAKTVLATPALDTDRSTLLRMERAWVAMRDNRPADAEADALEVWRKINIQDMAEVGGYIRNLLQVFGRPGSDRPAIAEVVKFAEARLLREKTSDTAQYQFSFLMVRDPVTRDAALKEFERLIREATTPEVIMSAAKQAGNLAFVQKNYTRAMEHYRAGLKAVPNDAELLNNAGYTLARFLNKPEEGLPLLEQAVQLAPNNASVLDSKGSVLMMLNRTSEAEPVLLKAREAARTQMELAPPIIHLIEVKLAKGERAAADALHRELQTLINNEPDPKQIEATYREDIDRVTQLLQKGGGA